MNPPQHREPRTLPINWLSHIDEIAHRRHWRALVLCFAYWVLACQPAWGDLASTWRQLLVGPPQVPHPAVVRVVALASDVTSGGSGTLISTDESYGYVLTNWHVVRDGTGDVTVTFPDGFQSRASVLKMDADWDLALLRIWRPSATPMVLAEHVPQPGEALTIAGYGSGTYRAAPGEATNYAAPQKGMPFELIDVSVPARQGDSGGPIVNGQGELAGVLFGTGQGTTTGSHIGRVRTFLASFSPVDSPAELPAEKQVVLTARNTRAEGATGDLQLSQLTVPTRPLPAEIEDEVPTTGEKTRPDPFGELPQETPAAPAEEPLANPAETTDSVDVAVDATDASQPEPQPSAPAVSQASIQPPQEDQLISVFELFGDNLWDRCKSILAIFGLLAICERVFWTPAPKEEE